MRAALVLLLGVAAVAALPRQEPARIIGGSVTTINNYPYAVALLSSFTGNSYSQSCGGSILNNRSVLTAAHCFIFEPFAWQWRSRVGSTWASSGGNVLNTAEIIRHPNYAISTNDHDFAVIRVSGNINYISNTVAPASIAGVNYNVADNQQVWAAGWGITESGSASEQLRHVQVWTVNQAVCQQRYATRGFSVTNSMLCSGWLDVGGRDQCQGDSGGPLIHNNVIVGVCSWGVGCADAFFPGVNARVSFASNWIVSNA